MRQPADHPDHLEVADGAVDRRGAHPEPAAQRIRRQTRLGGGRQRDEHAGRHAREPGGDEHCREALGERLQRRRRRLVAHATVSRRRTSTQATRGDPDREVVIHHAPANERVGQRDLGRVRERGQVADPLRQAEQGGELAEERGGGQHEPAGGDRRPGATAKTSATIASSTSTAGSCQTMVPNHAPNVPALPSGRTASAAPAAASPASTGATAAPSAATSTIEKDQ